MIVFAVAAAPHEDEVKRSPSNRLDGTLLHDTIAIQQRHVRRKTRSHSAKSDAFHCFAKHLIKLHECKVVAGAQHEWLAFSFAIKTHYTIEHDVKRPRQNP